MRIIGTLDPPRGSPPSPGQECRLGECTWRHTPRPTSATAQPWKPPPGICPWCGDHDGNPKEQCLRQPRCHVCGHQGHSTWHCDRAGASTGRKRGKGKGKSKASNRADIIATVESILARARPEDIPPALLKTYLEATQEEATSASAAAAKAKAKDPDA